MSALFEYGPRDAEVYSSMIRDFLPDAIVDIHAHVWLDAYKRHGAAEFDRVVSWPALVARDDSMEDLVETYRILFPDKAVTPLVFGEAGPDDDLEGMNAYVAEAARSRGFPALLFSRPEWDDAELEARLEAGSFAGIKVYLSFAPSYLPGDEIRIFDFLPRRQLEAIDRRGGIVMLHIPRSGRLRDPVNLAQLLEIERDYPRLRLVVAHAGRAYCEEDLGAALGALRTTKRMLFDFSANTNAAVFSKFLDAFGPERCLFGSDLPITRMRMRRICRGGTYVNLVPKGLYGDVSGDAHMAELEGQDALNLGFFLYEEILAIKKACETVGVGRAGAESIFHGNAMALLSPPVDSAATGLRK